MTAIKSVILSPIWAFAICYMALMACSSANKTVELSTFEVEDTTMTPDTIFLTAVRIDDLQVAAIFTDSILPLLHKLNYTPETFITSLSFDNCTTDSLSITFSIIPEDDTFTRACLFSMYNSSHKLKRYAEIGGVKIILYENDCLASYVSPANSAPYPVEYFQDDIAMIYDNELTLEYLIADSTVTLTGITDFISIPYPTSYPPSTVK